MEEKEVSEERINEHLEEIMDTEGVFENPSHVIKILAKLIYNLRHDLVSLITELKAVLSLPEEFEDEYVEKPAGMINNVRELYS